MGAFGRAFWLAFLALLVLFAVLVKYDSGPTSIPSESTGPISNVATNDSGGTNVTTAPQANAPGEPPVASTPGG